jgi:hypothetical protein
LVYIYHKCFINIFPLPVLRSYFPQQHSIKYILNLPMNPLNVFISIQLWQQSLTLFLSAALFSFVCVIFCRQSLY